MNDSTPINLTITKVYLTRGNYEGFDYFKLIAETNVGIKLQTKLTAYEYSSLLEKAQKQGK